MRITFGFLASKLTAENEGKRRPKQIAD